MKIKNIVKINNKEVKNIFRISFDLDENNKPFIYTEKKENKLNIPQNVTNKTLKTNNFNEGNSTSYFVLVENDMGEYIDLIKYNSAEYKKVIAKIKIKSSEIEKGTLVKLNNGKELIFLETLYELENKDFYEIFEDIIDVNKLMGIKQREKEERYDYLNKVLYFWSDIIFIKKNIFIEKNRERIIKLETKKIDFQIMDTYGVFKEFKEIKIANKITDLIDFNNIKYDKKGNIIRNLMEDRYVYLTIKDFKNLKIFIKKYLIELKKELN